MPYFSEFRGFCNNLEEAYDYLLQRRRCAEPNLGFLLQLIRYERKLRKKNESIEEQSTYEKKHLIGKCDVAEEPATLMSSAGEMAKNKIARLETMQEDGFLSDGEPECMVFH